MLLKHGFICDSDIYKLADVRIEGGKIIEIGSLQELEGEEVIDCKNKIIIPALIDLGIYPKNKAISLQSLRNLNQKCFLGGVGSVLLAGDTQPLLNSPSMMEWIELCNLDLGINVYPSAYGMIQKDKVADLSTLHQCGASALSVSSQDLRGHQLLVLANYAKMLDLPFLITPCDDGLSFGVIDEGVLATKLGLPSIPEIAFTKEVATLCEISRSLGVRMILNLVAPDGLKIIDLFKKEGLQVEVQVSIHHLVLDESIYEDYDTKAKIFPPLKSKLNQEKLIEFLKNHQISFLTSLQNASYNSQKDEVFELSSSGIDMISCYFSLLYTFLVKEKIISLKDLVALASSNQARALKLKKGAIQVGYDADLAILDLEQSFVCKDAYSPYFGKELFGKVECLLVGSKNTQGKINGSN